MMTITNYIPFDRKEAAMRLGISVPTLDRLLARKRIACVKVGRRILFTQELLDQFIAKCTVNAN